MKTQAEKIIDYCKENGSITAYDGAYKLGILQFSARICELQKAGIPVRIEPTKFKAQDGSMHPCKRYYVGQNCL